MKGLGLDHKDLDKAEAAIKKRLKDWDKAGPGFEKVWGADSKKKHEQLLREIQNIDHSPPSKEASDRSHLIRLASSMPKGSEMRRAILAGLREAYGLSTVGGYSSLKVIPECDLPRGFGEMYAIVRVVDGNIDSIVERGLDKNEAKSRKRQMADKIPVDRR
jgi:hypothetical protein